MRASTRKVSCKRNQTGGGLGGGWEFAPTSTAKIVNNDLAWSATGNCRAVPDVMRPGFLVGGYTGPKGLPGMSGGGSRKNRRCWSRKGRKGRKGSRKGRKDRRFNQAGGRYAADLSDPTVNGPPGMAGISGAMRIPCEASRSAIPDSGAANVLNKMGGPLWDSPSNPAGSALAQRGGGSEPVAGSAASVRGSDSPFEIVPSAGLTHLRTPQDSFMSAAGTKIMINVPENGRLMAPACLKTGGGRRRRISRKGRKGSRKNRK
jgi:hypothetical protein